MGIAALILLAFGIYRLIIRLRHKEEPEDTRQFGARMGRSIHGAIPLPGFMGQAPAEFMPKPPKDRIGPPDDHTLVVDASGRPVVNEPVDMHPLGPYRVPKATNRRAKGKKRQLGFS